MKQLKIDKYFADMGIKVRFNTLGYNDQLINSFVNDFRDVVDKGKEQNSAHTKLSCYSSMYTFEPRKKCTGFEKLSDLDSKFRRNAQHFVTEPQNTPLAVIENNKIDAKNISYKNALKCELSSIDDILVYYSGGVDSELVCKSLLESKKEFKVVIFQWTNNEGKIINEYDLGYAFKFCTDNDLNPIVKTINVENLWESKEFIELSKDLQLLSPQLVTYAYIVKYMAKEYTNVTHLLAGEVRFKTNYLMDDGSKANLVYLNKVLPAYNGYQYNFSDSGINPPGALIELYYNNGLVNGGNWTISAYRTVSPLPPIDPIPTTPPGGPVSGVWTTTPWLVEYEFRNVITVNSSSGIGFLLSPYQGSYGTIENEGFILTTMASLQIEAPPLGPTTYFADVTFEIFVRKTGDTVPEVVSTINFFFSITNTLEPDPPDPG